MKLKVALLGLATVASFQGRAMAWGTTGHLEINQVAMRALPAELPSFLRTEAAIAAITALGPEEDRLKGAGYSWDRDYDPAHYVDIGDDGMIAGSVSLLALPLDMEQYARALAKAGTDPYRTGYLPYAIADGWEQLREDFAYWRAFNYLHLAAARELRENLIVRDLGVWAHFVGDGSQPLHVSIHYNGWGDYPNPQGFTRAPIHATFEGAFVRAHVSARAVARLVVPSADSPPDHLLSQEEILAVAGRYLAATQSHVVTLYQVERSGGFRDATPTAVTFATQRVADGARELRDLVVLAWQNSLDASVGYPEVKVRAILNGSAAPNSDKLLVRELRFRDDDFALHQGEPAHAMALR